MSWEQKSCMQLQTMTTHITTVCWDCVHNSLNFGRVTAAARLPVSAIHSASIQNGHKISHHQMSE